MRWVTRGFVIALIVLIFVAGGGQAVLQLWNWLVPNIFGWRTITFWQAVGLLALCRILFGSFGGRPLYRSNWRNRMTQRWEHMTPEERERFRTGMRGRCGGFGPPADAPKA
jgi:hypothetical protein